MSPLGLYVPGSSVLHRTPAGAKLLVLVLAGLGSLWLDEVWQVLVALGVVLVGYGVAGLPLRVAGRQLRPLLWIAAGTAVFHVVVNGWERAFVVVGVLVDDAIVEIENIVRHLRSRPERGALRAALDASAEIGLAVMATTVSSSVMVKPRARRGAAALTIFPPAGGCLRC